MDDLNSSINNAQERIHEDKSEESSRMQHRKWKDGKKIKRHGEASEKLLE